MSSSTLPPPVDRFVQAVNQGDSQTFLSFFPKDGVVIDSGGALRDTMPSDAGATASSSVPTGG